MRTRKILPTVKQQKVSKYDSLVGSVVGTRKIVRALPRSLFEVTCLVCRHESVQRGIDLEKLVYRQCKKCQIDSRDPNLSNVFLRTRGNARVRNIDFKISKNEFSFIASQNCFYCNEPPQQGNKDFVERCKPYKRLTAINFAEIIAAAEELPPLEVNMGCKFCSPFSFYCRLVSQHHYTLPVHRLC